VLESGEGESFYEERYKNSWRDRIRVNRKKFRNFRSRLLIYARGRRVKKDSTPPYFFPLVDNF
jgi:hypothetical protein